MAWRYLKIALNEHWRKGSDIDLLCDAGKEHWELVTILPNNVAYLKSRIEEAPEQDATGNDPRGVNVRYRDPETGETWSGRGRMANWLKRKQDAGENIEKYRL